MNRAGAWGLWKARKIFASTPGVVGYGVFAQHGIAHNSAANYVSKLRREGWDIAHVVGLGWRLRMTCQARQYSDQMMCGPCALQWDVGDPEPPQCRRADPADSSFLNGGPATEPRPPRLVLFAGRKGVGKDTAARVLLDRGYENVKFADGLKIMLRALLAFRGCPDDEIERMIEGDLKETPTDYLNGRTPRYAMQTLGTDWGRVLMDRNLWVETTRDRIKAVGGPVVVTDGRFQNEVAMVEDMGGETVLIHGTSSGDGHPSEALVDKLVTRHRLHNPKGDKEDFLGRVRKLIFSCDPY